MQNNHQNPKKRRSNLVDQETVRRLLRDKEEAEQKAKEAEALAKQLQKEKEEAKKRQKERQAASNQECADGQSPTTSKTGDIQPPSPSKPITPEKSSTSAKPAAQPKAPAPKKPEPKKPAPAAGKTVQPACRRLANPALVIPVCLCVYQIFLYSLGRNTWPKAAELASNPFWLLAELPERLLVFVAVFVPQRLPLTACLAALLFLTYFQFYRRAMRRLPNRRMSLGGNLLRLGMSMLTVSFVTGLLYWSFAPTFDIPGTWGSLPVTYTKPRPYLFGGPMFLILGPIAFGIFYFFEKLCRERGAANVANTLLQAPEPLFFRLNRLEMWTDLLLFLYIQSLYAKRMLGFYHNFRTLPALLLIASYFLLCKQLKLRHFNLIREFSERDQHGYRDGYPFYKRGLALILCHWVLDGAVLLVYYMLPQDIYELLNLSFLGIGELWRWILATFMAERLLSLLNPYWNEQKKHRHHITRRYFRLMALIAIFALLGGPLEFAALGGGATLFDEYSLLRAAYETYDNTHGAVILDFPVTRELALPPLFLLAELLTHLAVLVLNAVRKDALCWPSHVALPALFFLGTGPVWDRVLPQLQEKFPDTLTGPLAGWYMLGLLGLGLIVCCILQRWLVWKKLTAPAKNTHGFR